MPGFLVQTESGSWYQVDTDEPAVLRWSERVISGLLNKPEGQANGGWVDMKVTQFDFNVSSGFIIAPHQPMRFLSNGAWVTTTKVISRTIIENLSKRRAVPA